MSDRFRLRMSDRLIAAKTMIADPEKWTQNEPFLGPTWCVDTALWHACDRGWGRTYATVFEFFSSIIETTDIPKWNDAPWRTHADVMAAFDRAIAEAQTRERTLKVPMSNRTLEAVF